MGPNPPDDPLDDTARIDRRNTVLAQIEAALLADKLSLEAAAEKAAGSDPYNSGIYRGVTATGVWRARRREG